jgi:Ca2+-binding EF-hand superfamily protein
MDRIKYLFERLDDDNSGYIDENEAKVAFGKKSKYFIQ